MSPLRFLCGSLPQIPVWKPPSDSCVEVLTPRTSECERRPSLCLDNHLLKRWGMWVMDPIYYFSRSQERPVGDPPVWWFGPSWNYMGEFCVSRNTASLDWKGQRQDEMKDEWLWRWFRGSLLLGPRGLPERVGPHSPSDESWGHSFQPKIILRP